MLEAKSRGRTPARQSAAAQVRDGGLVARLADSAFENPAMSGGLVVMALTAAAIVSNAMFLQSVRHPDPIFPTRPAAAVHAPKAPAVVPIPRNRADHIKLPASEAPTAADVAAAAPPQPTLVADLQEALAGRGLYRGAIDGKFGAQTQAAIAAFEKGEGLRVTGQATAQLLQHVKTAALPVPETVIVRTPEPAPAARPAAVPAPQPDAAALEQARYRRVQAALNSIGYGPVKVDGEVDDETANAIQRFELDNGLPVKGTANDQVIARLVKIGAMPAN